MNAFSLRNNLAQGLFSTKEYVSFDLSNNARFSMKKSDVLVKYSTQGCQMVYFHTNSPYLGICILEP
jgi:hypothetical protein